MNRQVVVRILQDGTGRVRIHWFCRDESGPIHTPGTSVLTMMGPLPLGGARGRIACQGELGSVMPRIGDDGQTHLVPHSDDVRAVTCPECRETAIFMAAAARLSELLETAQATPPAPENAGA